MKDSIHTLCIHAGSRDDPEGGVNTPLSMSSAYAYLGQDNVCYPRYYNTPNQLAVAEKLSSLEGAEAGLLFASGMAAISSLFLALLKPGDHLLVTRGCYGGTEHFIRHELPRYGIEVTETGLATADIAAGLQHNTRMIFVETPGNPLMSLVDLHAVAQLRQQRQLLLVADNTFATPIAQRPLSLGFDLVVHSATKYLGGHSDLSAGALAGSNALIQQIHEMATRYGGCLNAFDLWLLERSMKTLAIRIERQSANALQVAHWLEQTPGIIQVNYPGLKSHPDCALAQQQMACFGGMLSFDLEPGIAPGHFEASLQLIRSAVSLGGVESTICQPCLTSHAKLDEAARHAHGIGDRLMRLSVGIEQAEDILRDIRQALDVARQIKPSAAKHAG